MSELCAVHKIVAAPDGRCVLCRRPKLILPSDAEESLASRTLTALLGFGLLVAMAFAGYTFVMPSAEAAARTKVATQPAAQRAPLEVTQDAVPASSPRPPLVLSSQASEVTAAAPEASPAPEPSAKRKRVRTVGKKIVDPRLIEARKSVRVLMYSAPWCFICDRARTFLEAREVELVDYNVDLDELADRRLTQINPSGSIPTFVVDGKTIVGFHPWGLEDAIDAVAQRNYCTPDKPLEGAVCERLAIAE